MDEQLRQVRKRIQILEAKMEFQKENAAAMFQTVKDLGHDFDAFIEAFEDVQQQNDDRFKRVEERLTVLERK